jgi:lysophospholipase L1-like esterase
VSTRSGLMVLSVAALAALSSPSFAQNANWVAAWGASQQSLSEMKISNATARMIARVTLPGSAVRIRVDNTFGTAPLAIGHATLAPRVRGPAVATGLVKPVTFKGQPSVTIPAGGSVESDPIALPVVAQQDLAVSLYITGADMQPSQHNNAQVTSYLSANGSGDQTASADGKPFTVETNSMFWLKGIDVQPTAAASAIIAFGDSITDGTCSTLNSNDRWEDIVAQRLALQNPVRFAIVNEGIGGNTVTRAGTNPTFASPPGVERLDRDVLSRAGVSHVVLFMGTNDANREASAAEIIAGSKDIIARIKAKNIKVIGATMIPRHNDVWNEAKNKVKREVNAWIRKDAGFDAVLDFDAVMRDPAKPDQMIPSFNCGDNVHPAPIGYFQMGKSVDLSIFTRR